MEKVVLAYTVNKAGARQEVREFVMTKVTGEDGDEEGDRQGRIAKSGELGTSWTGTNGRRKVVGARRSEVLKIGWWNERI